MNIQHCTRVNVNITVQFSCEQHWDINVPIVYISLMDIAPILYTAISESNTTHSHSTSVHGYIETKVNLE